MTKLLILMFLSVVSLSAGTISLCSDLSDDEGNNITQENVDVTAHPAWAPEDACGKWISFANTGVEGSVLDNADTAGTPSSVFFESFVLGSNRTGTVRVWADDTARVRLVNSLHQGTGHVFVEPNPNQDGACAAGVIACQPDEFFTVVMDDYLAEGMNTLYIDAYQRGGGPFAVMYSGSASSTFTPEPGTYVLLGSGLVAFWFARRRMASRS